jgi:uncharacterized protein YcbK (DUF882 family)
MITLLNDIELQPDFWLSEFVCDGQVKIDMRLVRELQKLRDFIGKPINITSGYRTPERNKRIGGSSKSKHMEGIAADIYVDGISIEELYYIAKHFQFNGIGIYNYHLHVDVREKPAFWDERTVKTDLNNVFK